LRCAVCKNGETKPGKSVINITDDKSVFIFKNVPAKICHDCSEEYIDEEAVKLLLQTVHDSIKKGIKSGMQDWDKLSAQSIE
jgi:YgiT-type zinc finger domain-containing protein